MRVAGGLGTRAMAVIIAIGLFASGCLDSTRESRHTHVGAVAIIPVYPANGRFGAFTDIIINTVKLHIERPPNEVVFDSLFVFPSNQNQLSLVVQIPLQAQREVLPVTLELRSNGQRIFAGTKNVVITEQDGAATSTDTIPVSYVGPGTDIQTLQILPHDTVFSLGEVFRFQVAARDSSDRPVAEFYVSWSTSDSTIAPIDAFGTVRGPARRAYLTLRARTPTGIVDSTHIAFAKPATQLLLASGDGQTGGVASPLPQPLVAQVLDADGVGIPGTRVFFAAVGSSGSIRDTIAITDSAGYARTIATLGPQLGTRTFQATVRGLFTINFVETAVAGPPTILTATIGTNQQDTVGKRLPVPLELLVTDAFGNPNNGATIAWQVASGGGQLSATSTPTGVDGKTRVLYTLGTRSGTNVVVATIPGTATSVTFTSAALTGAPRNIASVSGNGQSGIVNQPLAAPFVAAVSDLYGNPVAGATVDWRVTAGAGNLSTAQTFTGANGQTQVSFVLGTVSGNNVITAVVAASGTAAVFDARALPSAPTVISVAQGNNQSNLTGLPLGQLLAVRVADTFQNPVPGVKIDWQVTRGTGQTTTLSSTTDQTGVASNGYRLGTTPGQELISATISGTKSTVIFSENALARIPSSIVIVSGDHQTGSHGSNFPAPLIVQVTDKGGIPVVGASVSFSDSTSTVLAATDSIGMATAVFPVNAAGGNTQFVTATVFATILRVIFTLTGL